MVIFSIIIFLISIEQISLLIKLQGDRSKVKKYLKQIKYSKLMSKLIINTPQLYGIILHVKESEVTNPHSQVNDEIFKLAKEDNSARGIQKLIVQCERNGKDKFNSLTYDDIGRWRRQCPGGCLTQEELHEISIAALKSGPALDMIDRTINGEGRIINTTTFKSTCADPRLIGILWLHYPNRTIHTSP